MNNKLDLKNVKNLGEIVIGSPVNYLGDIVGHVIDCKSTEEDGKWIATIQLLSNHTKLDEIFNRDISNRSGFSCGLDVEDVLDEKL